MRRWLKRVALAIWCLIALALWGVVGAFAWLQTQSGAEYVRAQLLPRVNAQLSGHLEVGQLQLSGRWIVLRDVTLRDTEGDVVAAAEEIAAQLRPSALLHRTAELNVLRIVRPYLDVVKDERGTNLQRALAPRTPKAPQQPKQGGGFSVAVNQLVLIDGRVVYEQTTGPRPLTVALGELDAQGSAALLQGGERLWARIGAAGQLAEPLQGPASLRFSINGVGERRAIYLELDAAGAALTATARLDGMQDLTVEVSRLRLPPDVVSAFAPSYPLLQPLTGTAQVKRQGPEVNATAELAAGSARLHASGEVNLDTWRSTGLRLDAEHVNLSELVEQGPRSDLALSLRGHGGGRSLDTLEGAIQLTAPASAIDGATFGPVQVEASASGGQFQVQKLTAQLPGLVLSARGEGDRQTLHLFGFAAASDLNLFARTLGKLAGPKGLPVSGKGALGFEIDGPLHSPSVLLAGRFPRLRYAENAARELRVELSLPNARAPLEGNALVSLSAARVTARGKTFVSPKLRLLTAGRSLRVNASTRGFATLSLAARGEVDPDRRGFSLGALTLAYPGARWRLEHRAHVRIASGEQRISGLALRSGKQRISVDSKKRGARVEATASVDQLRLERLPRAFVPKAWNLAGQLSLNAHVQGSTSNPKVDAQVKLTDAQVKQYQHVDLSLDASYTRERARGKVSAQALGISARGDFDLPLKALKTGGPERVRADLTVADVSIQSVAEKLGKQLPVKGVLGATLHLAGTASDPRLDAELRGQKFVYQDLPPVDGTLAVKTEKDGTVVARLDADVQAKKSFVTVKTPWTLGRLIRHRPTTEQALHSPLTVDGKLEGFPVLAKLGARVPSAKPVPDYAFLDGTVHLEGTPLSPRGTVALTLRDVQVPNGLPLSATARADFGATRVALSGKVIRATRELLSFNGAVDASVAQLRSRRALEQAPLTIEAKLGPIPLMELQQLQPRIVTPNEQPRPLFTGVLLATARGSGTLRAPRLEVDASVHGLGTAQSAALGDVSVRYRYADTRNTLAADLLSTRGGKLELRANAALDLSFPSLRRGLEWRTAPLTGSLRAQQFDPTFLSGVTPLVQGLGGTLEASLDLSGHLSLPHVKGRLEWKDGRLALRSYGSYEQIHVLMSGDEQRVQLQEATAHAGRGEGRMTGTFTRQGEAVGFDLKAELKEFPIINQDQLMATATLNATAKGTASLERIDVPELRVPEAHLELPETGHKKLQELKPPEDVVWLVYGKPLEEKKQGAAGTGGSGTVGGAPGQAGREILLHVIAPRNVWIKGKDVNVEIGLGDNFQVRLDQRPLVFGDVLVRRGYLEMLSRRFELSSGSKVTFTGPVKDPRLDVAAVYTDRREDVTVTLRVTGPAQHLQIQPSSEPPLTETQIYTLIATGRLGLAPGTTSTSTANPATSVIGGLIASELKKGIQSVLPIDVLSIQAGERGVSGTRVEAGTYVTDRLYLGVQSTLGAQRQQGENQNQLRAEYQLWRHWMLELEYGDAGKGSGDLLWRKSY